MNKVTIADNNGTVITLEQETVINVDIIESIFKLINANKFNPYTFTQNAAAYCLTTVYPVASATTNVYPFRNNLFAEPDFKPIDMSKMTKAKVDRGELLFEMKNGRTYYENGVLTKHKEWIDNGSFKQLNTLQKTA